jgi:enoyl-CoA hydratase/carnithine racemase
VRELGPALTKELVLTSRSFGADEALAIRFVNRVATDEELDAATTALAEELASKSRYVLRTTKRQVDDAMPAVPATDGGVDADVAALAGAFADPDSRAAATRYRKARGHPA